MRVQQEDLLDEVELCKDIEKGIKKRYEQLLQDDEYKCRKYSLHYEFVRDSLHLWDIFFKVTIFSSLIVFIYYQIIQWIELNDDQKWIYQTYIPWGLVYILITIPIIIIQGPDYINQSVKEKEIIQLFNDYNMIKQLNNQIPDFDQNYSIENIHPNNMKNIILSALLIIQFFSDGFYSVITQLVALQYFSEIQRIVLRSLARRYFSLNKLPGEFNEKVKAYFQIWNIKMIDQIRNIAGDAFYSIIKKQKKNSKEMLQQDGNQIKLLFSERFQSIIKFTIIGSLSIFLAYSFQKSWSQSLIEDKGYFKIEVPSYLSFCMLIYVSESITSDDCQIYMMNLINLYYLKQKYRLPYYQIKRFHDHNSNTVAKIYAENNQYQFFYLTLQIWCMLYSKPTELILNFCSLNYIYNIDQIGIDRFFCNCTKSFYQILYNHPWFQYSKQFKLRNFNLFLFLYAWYVQQLETIIIKLLT